MSKFTIEQSGLTPDRENANAGTQRGRGLLEKSLRKLGAGRSVLADKNGNIIAGNKTLEGAAEIDLPVRIVETDGTELVVVKRTDLDLYSTTDKRGRQLAYADNKVAELDLSWKPEQIAADFAPLELGEWGFQELSNLDFEAFDGEGDGGGSQLGKGANKLRVVIGAAMFDIPDSDHALYELSRTLDADAAQAVIMDFLTVQS